jgi:hypothetical protein
MIFSSIDRPFTLYLFIFFVYSTMFITIISKGLRAVREQLGHAYSEDEQIFSFILHKIKRSFGQIFIVIFRGNLFLYLGLENINDEEVYEDRDNQMCTNIENVSIYFLKELIN